MPIRIPANHGVSNKQVDQSGNYTKPGWGHFFLEAVDEQDDHVKLLFACLGHTDADQIDSKTSMWLYFVAGQGKNPKPLFEKVMHAGKVFNLLSPEEIDRGGALAIDFTPAIGRQCVLHIVESEYKDKEGKEKKSTKVADKGIYRVDDEIVLEKKVPLDMNHLRLGGYSPPKPGGSVQANGATAGAAQESQGVSVKQSGDEDLAGL